MRENVHNESSTQRAIALVRRHGRRMQTKSSSEKNKDCKNSLGKKKDDDDPKPNGKKSDPNKCRLPGHDHEFKDCPNNPKSKNYNGTHYSKMWKKIKEDQTKEKNWACCKSRPT